MSVLVLDARLFCVYNKKMNAMYIVIFKFRIGRF